tara:strand:- start:66 stop:416 length:351 start_codon:yes stop_codon:yes gene_type:complete
MNFTKSIEVCFNKFANFEGRSRKSEFWWFQLFCITVQIVGMIIDALLGYAELFVWIGYIIVLLPSLAVGARRLHDTGRSGWWQLLFLTIIGVIVLIVWWVADGDKKKNKFGQPIKL